MISLIIIFGILFLHWWIGQPKNGGRIGESVRASDHWAWQGAIRDRKLDIFDRRLRIVRGKGTQEDEMEIENLEYEIEMLKRSEPEL